METLLGMTIGQLVGRSVGILFVLSLFIEITPIKWDPLSSILKWIGNKMNDDIHKQINSLKDEVGSVNTKVDALEQKVEVFKQDVKKDSDLSKAVSARTHILTFGGEEARGQVHTKDEFDNVMTYMDVYKTYCDEHKDFQNGITVSTCKFINDLYDHNLSTCGFLR